MGMIFDKALAEEGFSLFCSSPTLREKKLLAIARSSYIEDTIVWQNCTIILPYCSSKTRGGMQMAGSVYKLIELVGTSQTSIEDAVQNALAQAGESVREMRWFTVEETRGTIDGGKVGEWQVTLKIGFRIEE
jgi:dodecin